MNTLRALVVDDDPICLLLMETILGRAGVEVTTSGDSRQALFRILSEPESFDLLVTDFQMPGLDGMELIDQVQSSRPDLAVLLVTSQLERALASAAPAGPDAFLEKPFGESEMNLALCRALEGQADRLGRGSPPLI